MHNTCIDLGSGKTKGTGIGDKARFLDIALRSRLTVPRGLIIRGEARLEALLLGLLDEDPKTGEMTCPRPQAFADWLDFPTFSGLVRALPAFGIDLDPAISPDIPHVNLNDAPDMATALCTIWSAASRVGGDFRRDVIVMEMVEGQIGGTAYTQHDYEDDIVLVTTQSEDTTLEQKVLIPQLWRMERKPDQNIEAWTQRLQVLLRQVRTVFGHRDWMIEWADDGTSCYLLRIEAIVQPPARDEVFIKMDHSNLFSAHSELFFVELIASCSQRFKKRYRTFTPSLPEARPLIEVYNGSPYLNLSLVADMRRTLGLATRDFPAHLGSYPTKKGRILLNTLRGILPRMVLSNWREAREIETAKEKVIERMQNPGETWEDLIITARWLYVQYIISQGVFPLMAALLPKSVAKPNRVRANWSKWIQQQLETIWQLMLDKANVFVAEGYIPEVDLIWQMTIGELCQLDNGWNPELDFFELRQTEMKEQDQNPLPNLIHSLDKKVYDGSSSSAFEVRYLNSKKITQSADDAEEPSYEILEDFSANKQIRIVTRGASSD